MRRQRVSRFPLVVIFHERAAALVSVTRTRRVLPQITSHHPVPGAVEGYDRLCFPPDLKESVGLRT